MFDLVFMVAFALIAFLLLRRNKKNLRKQGWIFLYHSKFGLKSIDWVAKKFSRILKPLQYVVVASGYILMALMVWMLGLSVWRYVTTEIPKELQNVPPVAPLIPYFPRLFGLESLFPPLYFTYFLIALAIVAVSHEFAHGIFARLNNIRVKTTGLAFFGPFFGAFVEPDEKQMNGMKKFPQLSILAAGTFANVIMTLLFLVILALFFAVSFTPGGVIFNAYPQSVIQVDSIQGINGNLIDGLDEIDGLLLDGEFNELDIQGTTFLVPSGSLLKAKESGAEQIFVFDDAPAIRVRLDGPILEFNGVKVLSQPALSDEISKYSPGQEIEIKTLDETGEVNVQNIVLGDNGQGKAYLGIGFINPERKGFVGKLFGVIQEIKDPLVYYVPAWDGEFVQFIYDLLWWIIVINILVALFNMLPVSILDGGRFFYLTIWGITGKEKWGKRAYSWATWFILFLILLMVVRWLFVFIN